MTTPDRKFLLLFFIVSFSGCSQLDKPISNMDILQNQTEPTIIEEGIMVPQTLAPSPRNELKQAVGSETISAPVVTTPSTRNEMALQTSAEVKAPSPSTQRPTNPSSSRTSNIFGEFPGVSSQWEGKKRQLTIQLQEQSLKVDELKLKLQLINQVAEHISFMTKASVDEQNAFFMEFTIENRAPFAIKDIAITCDQVAPTGTIINSHVETLYDLIKPSTRSTYAPIPYGNKHRQTQALQCQITNFTAENASSDVS